MHNDLISRKALKEDFMLWFSKMTDNKRISASLMQQILCVINDAPTVELLIGRMVNGVIIPVKRPKGKWIHHDERWDICSNCGLGFRDLCLDGFNFCPYCGAEMRKE